MRDRVTRRAAGWATLVALPLAGLVGWVSFVVLGGGGDGSTAPSTRRATPPQAPTMTPATGAVDMPARALSGRTEVVCRALLSQLPQSLRDRGRRPVSAGAEQNAAYGDPPITVACGTAAASFPPTDTVYVLDRVCWHAATTPVGTVWTTVDREVPVRVTVPAAYEGPGQWVIEFSGSLIATVPSGKKAPGGCNP